MIFAKEHILKYKEGVLFTLFFLTVLIFYSCQKNETLSNKNSSPNENGDAIDLLIPLGHSLVPIEVANYETLDSLLGPFGVVDLFSMDAEKPEVSRKVATMVKILRAPKNPSHFAVLVPTSLAYQILKVKGPFVVSVQNPKRQSGMHFEKTTAKRSRIIYE